MHNSQLAEVLTNSHSRNQARLWMEKICGPHELDTRIGSDELDFHYHAQRLPGLSLMFGDISYGTAVSIGVDGRNGLQAYSISLPTCGEQSLVTPGCRTCSDQQQGLILSPDTFQQLDMEEQCEKQQLVIPASALRAVAESLLHTPLQQPLRFDPAMDMRNPAIQAWWQMVQQLMGQGSSIQALYSHSLLTRDLETALIKGLLLAQPNSISNQLQQTSSQPHLPAYLERACRFIQRHMQDDIGIEAIVACTGVSRFTLFSAFRDYLHTTPMAWQRNLRLDSVRECLLKGAAGQSVSAVALDCGFSHLGRFASQYRERFGERPSDTLARSKLAAD
ncbi:AraC family transcriptional regulator [Oceanobacter mangrovi]|uniref:AraC family transcriptional regulator n=1 Tax=Oceanobacter mangrovi TaxID=2862510 RepID=UPI001C8D73A9|nr:AraC family transcriptional regulator [Oceanobacter mangrovi]